MSIFQYVLSAVMLIISAFIIIVPVFLKTDKNAFSSAIFGGGNEYSENRIKDTAEYKLNKLMGISAAIMLVLIILI